MHKQERLHAYHLVLLTEKRISLLVSLYPSSTEESCFIYSKIQACCFHTSKAVKSAHYVLSVTYAILESSILLSGGLFGFFFQSEPVFQDKRLEIRPSPYETINN